MDPDLPPVDRLNFATASAVCFAGFLRSGEVTYEARDLKNQSVFNRTGLQRSDITFSEDDDHVLLLLKVSKTDEGHRGVHIVLVATRGPSCPVVALRRLFNDDPQPPDAPLFRFSGRAFSHSHFVETLRGVLMAKNVPNSNLYSSHSYRRGAASTAKNSGMAKDDIQRLGRWTSECFQRYIDTDITYRFRLSKLFLTGVSPPLSQRKP
jgi:hypothetical protein